MINSIFSVADGKIRFISLKNEERKILHQYLDKNFPHLRKASVHCKKFGNDGYRTYIRCCRTLVLMKYHYGKMTNNKDEHYSGTCSNCEEDITWECNYYDYDDVVKKPIKHKMFVFGDYNFQNTRHIVEGEVSTETVTQLLKDKTVYEILAPKSGLSSTQLAFHIYWSQNNSEEEEQTKESNKRTAYSHRD